MTFLKNLLGSSAIAVLLLAGFGNSHSAKAQDLKVGFANAELVLIYVPEYKQIGEKVQRQLQSSQEMLQAKADEFQQAYDKFEKQADLLPPDKRQQRADELNGQYQTLQQLQVQKEGEVSQYEAGLMNPLVQKVQKAVDQVAAEQGLDLVLKSPGILYVNPDRIVDITNLVASKLGVDLEKELSANAK